MKGLNFSVMSMKFKSVNYDVHVNFIVNEFDVYSSGTTFTITAGDGVYFDSGSGTITFTTANSEIVTTTTTGITTTAASVDDGVFYLPRYTLVENSILDMLSQELEMDVNKDILRKLLNGQNLDEDESE